MAKNPLAMLVILDGWGWREDPADNAVLQAQYANFRPAVVHLPARLPAHIRQGRGPAAGARWATPRSAT